MKSTKASWAPPLNIIIIIIVIVIVIIIIIIIIIIIKRCSHKTDHEFASHCHFRDILTSGLWFKMDFLVGISCQDSSWIFESGFDVETWFWN